MSDMVVKSLLGKPGIWGENDVENICDIADLLQGITGSMLALSPEL